MAEYPLAFRTSLWVLGLVSCGLVISVAGTWYFSSRTGASIETFGFIGLSIMFAAGLVEGLLARVVLGTELLEMVSNFKRTRVRREEIVRAVGERGVPVAVELRSGGWLKLPALGTGPHANTVRAWLRNAPQVEGSQREETVAPAARN